MRTRIPGLYFETVPEATPAAGGGEPPAPAAVEPPGGGADPPAPAAVEPPAPTPAEPDYGAALQSPQGQEALQQAVAEALAGFGVGQPEPEPGLTLPDPFDDDYSEKMAAYLEARDQQMIQQFAGNPAIQHAEQEHQQRWVTDTFGTIEKTLELPEGKHLPEPVRDLAVAIAAGNRPPDWHPSAASFDPGRALTDATRGLHDLIQQERAAAVAEYQQGIAGPAGARTGAEPPAGGAAGVRTEPVPADMRGARIQWEIRQGLRSPDGELVAG